MRTPLVHLAHLEHLATAKITKKISSAAKKRHISKKITIFVVQIIVEPLKSILR
jgi:hypothetical protein